MSFDENKRECVSACAGRFDRVADMVMPIYDYPVERGGRIAGRVENASNPGIALMGLVPRRVKYDVSV